MPWSRRRSDRTARVAFAAALTLVVLSCSSNAPTAQTGHAVPASHTGVEPVDDEMFAASEAAMLELIGSGNDLRSTIGEAGWDKFVLGYREANAQLGEEGTPSRGLQAPSAEGDSLSDAQGFLKQMSENATAFAANFAAGTNSSSTQSIDKDWAFEQDGTAYTTNFHIDVSFESLNGKASVDLAANGTLSLPTAAGQPVTFNIRLSGGVAATACPDADGNVIADGHLEIQLGVAGSALDGGSVTVEVDTRSTGTVGDDALLQTVDWTSNVSGSVARRAEELGSIGFTNSGRMTLDEGRLFGGTSTSTGTTSDVAVVGTFFPQVNQAVQGVQEGIASITADFLAGDVQERWRSGGCVAVRATEESRAVTPGEEVQFTATTWHLMEGRDLDAPITSSLAGTASLSPMPGPDSPPVIYTYTAPETSGESGVITLRSVSRRGIGELTLTFTAANKKVGWLVTVGTIDGGEKYVCDISQPFTVDGAMGPVVVTPTSDHSGSIFSTFEMEDMTLSATANYSVTFDPSDGGAGQDDFTFTFKQVTRPIPYVTPGSTIFQESVGMIRFTPITALDPPPPDPCG